MKFKIKQLIPLFVIGVLSVGVMYYSVKLGVGGIYTKAVTNEIKNMPLSIESEGAAESIEHKQQFIESMLSWNSASPHNLIMAGYFKTYLGRLSDDKELTESGTELFEQAIALRPLWPEPYIQKAYTGASEGIPLEEVFEEVEKAIYVGPYENATAKTVLNIYFANWAHLNTSQRIKAGKVVLKPQHYGFRSGYNSFLRSIPNSPGKKRICNILKAKGINDRECK